MEAGARTETGIRYELLEPSVPNLVTKCRRRFIIVVCFDFLLCFLLWVLFVTTKTFDWKHEFIKQINLSDRLFFYNSLFDIVILSCIRLHILTICYGCIRMKHWMPVAITTAATTFYTCVKAVVYFTHRHAGLPMEFAVVLCSLVLCFFEIFMYDSRFGVRNSTNDAESIVNSTEQTARPDEYTTAYDISSSSSGEDCGLTKGHGMTKYIGEDDATTYTKRVLYALEFKNVWMEELAVWKKVSSVPLILSTQHEEFGKVFYLKHELPVSVELLFELLYVQTESCVEWHKDILVYKVLCTLGNGVDLTYSVSAPSMRGYIVSREFFDVRMLISDQQGIYTVSSISYAVSAPPQNSNHVRGENGPNIVTFTSLDPNRCQLEWFFNTNLKGNLPRSLVNRCLVQFLINFVHNLEGRLRSL